MIDVAAGSSYEADMNSCQEILKSVLAERTTRNPGYSLRSFARDLGLSPAFMSAFLSGCRGLSPETAEKISAKLPLDRNLKERFVKLAAAEFARSSHIRESAKEYLRSKQARQAVKQIAVSEDLLRNWYHMAILEAIADAEFEFSIDNLCKRLRLTRFQVEAALDTLISIEAIKVDEHGNYLDNLGSLEIEDASDSVPLRKFHSQILDLAEIALTEQSSKDIYSQSMLFSASEDLIPQINKILKQCIFDISNVVSNSEGKGKIRCLTLQSFKIDR